MNSMKKTTFIVSANTTGSMTLSFRTLFAAGSLATSSDCYFTKKAMVCAHFATRWYKMKTYLCKHQCMQQQEYKKNQLSNAGRDKPSKQ